MDSMARVRSAVSLSFVRLRESWLMSMDLPLCVYIDVWRMDICEQEILFVGIDLGDEWNVSQP